MSRGVSRDIAIVGMGCRFAGAPDLFAFWSNILTNRDVLRELPAGRCPLDFSHGPDLDPSKHPQGRRGGYLDASIPVEMPAQAISSLEALAGEPEQVLLLDAARAALRDAAINPDKVDQCRAEVVIGQVIHSCRGEFTRLQVDRMAAGIVGLMTALHPEWSEEETELLRRDLRSSSFPVEAATPDQFERASNPRLVDLLDLKGVSHLVDAAENSALVALDLGRRALLDRRADLVLVGAVYLGAERYASPAYKQVQVLAPPDESLPSSAQGNAMIPGEGVGVLVLKRQADAERSGDRIYAVIRGVGLAREIRGPGLVAYRTAGPLRAMRRAYRDARVDPGSVALIEGHGLGIPAADRVELLALRTIFRPGGPQNRVLGAVSSQIGHAMPVAGMAGLIKTALALHHRVLPPTRRAKRPIRLLNGSGLELISTPRPWIHGEPASPRRAGVCGLGLEGTYAHAVLEEHAASADGMTDGAMLNWDSEAFLLAAPDARALAERVILVRERIARGHGGSLKDLAYTLNASQGVPEGKARLGLVAGSREELLQNLELIESRLRAPQTGTIRDSRGIYLREEPLWEQGSLAFLFPGEGSQYPGMLADLCPHFPELREVLDTADRLARESGEAVPPSRHLFGAPGTGSEGLWAADIGVTAVVSSQWGMFQVLSRLGLKPDAVVGQSSGELPALAAAGAILTERAFERQLVRLASVFRQLESSGAIPSARLVAVGTSRERAEAACAVAGGSVRVAIDNCPHQVVLAGPPMDIESVISQLRAQNVLCEELPFARAYHTPSFSSVQGPLDEFYSSLDLHPSRLPIYSCSTAARMPDSPAELRRLAAGQWTRTVRFRDTIDAMYRDGLRVFVDLGTRGNLCGYVEDILRGRPAFAVAACLPRRSGTFQLNNLVASLFAQGLSIDTALLYARRRPRRLDLDALHEPIRSTFQLRIGFPELKLSEETICSLARKSGQSHQGGSNTFPLAPEHAATEEPQTHNGHTRILEHPYEQVKDDGNSLDRLGLESLSKPRERRSINGTGDTLSSAPSGCGDSIHNDELAVLGFQETMNAFLETEREVMDAYLRRASMVSTPSGEMSGSSSPEREVGGFPEPGPWVGQIEDWEPGQAVVARFSLNPVGDPVAENHTLGGRRVSALQPELKAMPVVPFAVMTEMVAQIGSLLVPPGQELHSLHEVRAHRWVPYEEAGWLELRGVMDSVEPASVRVTLFHHKAVPAVPLAEGRPVFEGVARFAERRSEPASADFFRLSRPRPSRFTAEGLYEEQWLFHGPPMQALAEVGLVSPDGIEGAILRLPLAPLARPGTAIQFSTDPIVLDTFTHLLGCWGLDCLEGGDVIFPLRMDSLLLHGDPPPEGTRVDCRIRVREVEHHRVRVDAEILRPDGLVWMRIEGWEDWRFHWPARYRDVFRAPDQIFVGEELRLPGIPPTEALAVWLAPPADMARPVWRDVLEHIQLGPEERSACLAPGDSETRRTHTLWGRIAAKEAVRRIWRAAGDTARYPADLAVEHDRDGRPRLIDRFHPEDCSQPAVSIAHSEGLTVALAARDANTKVGVDVALVAESPASPEGLHFSEGELDLLERWQGEARAEWMARFTAAKQSAAKAAGIGPSLASYEAEGLSVDARSGALQVKMKMNTGTIFKVNTERRGKHVWAWTLGEG